MFEAVLVNATLLLDFLTLMIDMLEGSGDQSSASRPLLRV
jgi:hypothetical protein